MGEVMQSVVSVPLFPLYLLNQLIIGLACVRVMSIGVKIQSHMSRSKVNAK